MIGMIGKTLKKERLLFIILVCFMVVLIEEKQQNKNLQHENIKFFFFKTLLFGHILNLI